MLFLVLLLCAAMVGCGAVGEPLPPLLDIPQPVKNLVAAERGERVLLSWPPPVLTMEGVAIRPEKLGPVRLYRAVVSGSRMGDAQKDFEAAATEVARFDPGVREYADPVNPAWVGQTAVYALRMSNRRGESAGFSNLAVVPVLQVPRAPELKARTTKPAVVLDWSAQPGNNYHVYRDGQLLATVSGGHYEDREFEFGREYRYLVRGLAEKDGFLAEGSDSNIVTVKPEDIFPPQAPQGLTALVVEEGQPRAVELSWSPNNEADLAGYNVYRGPQKLNHELLLSPTFRDASPGPSPRYSVTAVDRRGNESAHSQEVTP